MATAQELTVVKTVQKLCRYKFGRKKQNIGKQTKTLIYIIASEKAFLYYKPIRTESFMK